MHCVALAKLLAILGFKTSVASHKPAGHVIYVQRIVCVHMTVTTPKGTSFRIRIQLCQWIRNLDLDPGRQESFPA
jgi:hypothetical protein